MKAYFHSVNTFGTVDGPGIRYVLFLSGCKLGCSFCHNPDTWVHAGDSVCSEEILSDIKKYRSFYDASGGGLTISGGEPLLQADFVAELFRLCRQIKIATALDTGGFAKTGAMEKALENADLILFSLKAAREKTHRSLTGKSNGLILRNLELAAATHPIILRYAVIPGLNDAEDDVSALAARLKQLPSSLKLELLPYHAMGKSKWASLGLSYRLDAVREATEEDLSHFKYLLNQHGVYNKHVC